MATLVALDDSDPVVDWSGAGAQFVAEAVRYSESIRCGIVDKYFLRYAVRKNAIFPKCIFHVPYHMKNETFFYQNFLWYFGLKKFNFSIFPQQITNLPIKIGGESNAAKENWFRGR